MVGIVPTIQPSTALEESRILGSRLVTPEDDRALG
jgi:hypothetical protein